MAASRPRPTDPCQLRADAARNRQLIIETAQSAFADRGLGVRMDEIAQEAGLGTGTVYRRFANKDELVRAVFEQGVEEFVALADRILAADTDGTGLRQFFEEAGEIMTHDRGLQQILTGSFGGSQDLSAVARARIEPRARKLVRNAQAAGRLRPDLTHDDMPVIQIMLTAVIEATHQIRADLWKRYYTLVLDGLEPGAANHRLPQSPPDGDEAQTIIERWRSQPRQLGARG
jgi:AcrR family transcriptional regulator